MVQLFFRLNEQQHRNSKYKNSKKSGSTEPSRRGHSPEEPIDVDALETLPGFHASSYVFLFLMSVLNDWRLTAGFREPHVLGAPPTLHGLSQNPATRDHNSDEHRSNLDHIYNVPDGTSSEKATVSPTHIYLHDPCFFQCILDHMSRGCAGR
jgi:hypothetical protein